MVALPQVLRNHRYRFPVIFGAGLLLMYAAFRNRLDYVKPTEEDIQKFFRSNPETLETLRRAKEEWDERHPH